MAQNKFQTEFKKILKSYNIEAEKEFDRLEAKAKTNLGDVCITCLNGWIAMRFEQKDFSISKFFEKFSEHEPLNKWSYKWNIHFSDKEVCLIELDARLNALMN